MDSNERPVLRADGRPLRPIQSHLTGKSAERPSIGPFNTYPLLPRPFPRRFHDHAGSGVVPSYVGPILWLVTGPRLRRDPQGEIASPSIVEIPEQNREIVQNGEIGRVCDRRLGQPVGDVSDQFGR